MSLPPEYFEQLYGRYADPWGFADRWYERRKRALLLAALPRERFRSAFEPGCSTGELTAELAARCDRLLAVDVSERVLARARDRLAPVQGARAEGVQLRRAVLPADWPQEEHFDLVVVSEVGYYLDLPALATMADLAAGSLTPDGVLATCHWRHRVPDYPQTGDLVQDTLAAAAGRAGLSELVDHVEEDFRMQLWVGPQVPSVARGTGLV